MGLSQRRRQRLSFCPRRVCHWAGRLVALQRASWRQTVEAKCRCSSRRTNAPGSSVARSLRLGPPRSSTPGFNHRGCGDAAMAGDGCTTGSAGRAGRPSTSLCLGVHREERIQYACTRLLPQWLALGTGRPSPRAGWKPAACSRRNDSISSSSSIAMAAPRAPTPRCCKTLDTAANGAGQRQGLGLGHVRRLAVGADVVRASRKLDRVGAETLMRRSPPTPASSTSKSTASCRRCSRRTIRSYTQQWHYFNATAGIGAHQAWEHAAPAPASWSPCSTPASRRTPTSTRNLVAGYDFISDAAAARDGNGRDADSERPGDWSRGRMRPRRPGANSSWHGTHVAGTVAAVTNNGSGVAGVAFDAKVSRCACSASAAATISDIADAIVWASGGTVTGMPANANPAEVINMSLGGGGACGATMQARDQQRGRRAAPPGGRGRQRERRRSGFTRRPTATT